MPGAPALSKPDLLARLAEGLESPALLVVGDVVGHGLSAAATIGRPRHAVPTLAARERARIAIKRNIQACLPSACRDATLDLGSRDMPESKRKGDIFERRHMRVERVVLKYHRHRLAAVRAIAGPYASDLNFARVGAFEARDQS